VRYCTAAHTVRNRSSRSRPKAGAVAVDGRPSTTHREVRPALRWSPTTSRGCSDAGPGSGLRPGTAVKTNSSPSSPHQLDRHLLFGLASSRPVRYTVPIMADLPNTGRGRGRPTRSTQQLTTTPTPRLEAPAPVGRRAGNNRGQRGRRASLLKSGRASVGLPRRRRQPDPQRPGASCDPPQFPSPLRLLSQRAESVDAAVKAIKGPWTQTRTARNARVVLRMPAASGGVTDAGGCQLKCAWRRDWRWPPRPGSVQRCVLAAGEVGLVPPAASPGPALETQPAATMAAPSAPTGRSPAGDNWGQSTPPPERSPQVAAGGIHTCD
jgi:hypothetical protein